MSLTIQERIKDLRVERRLTLKELEEQTGLSSSALGSYEADDTKDISHYALIRLAKFYGVTVDYLLGLTETKHHPNADLADLRLSDAMIEVLKAGRVDTALLGGIGGTPGFHETTGRHQHLCERHRRNADTEPERMGGCGAG